MIRILGEKCVFTVAWSCLQAPAPALPRSAWPHPHSPHLLGTLGGLNLGWEALPATAAPRSSRCLLKQPASPAHLAEPSGAPQRWARREGEGRAGSPQAALQGGLRC